MSWTTITPNTGAWTSKYPGSREIFSGGWFQAEGWFRVGWFSDIWSEVDELINTWTKISAVATSWTEKSKVTNTWSS